MVIAVNTRLLLDGKMEGLGWFAYENLKRITTNHPEHRFIFIFDRPFHEKFVFNSNVTPVIAHPQSRHPVLWYLFFDWGIPPLLKKYKADLFFSPDGWLSLMTNVKSLPVIHDLNFFHEPQWVDRAPRFYYNYFFPKFISKAHQIGTVSEYSKNDIITRFGIGPDKVDVIYNGSNESYTPISEEGKKHTREKYAQGEEYFLFIGLVHPRKNLTRIIQAFNMFKKRTGNKNKFIVVGSTAYWTADTRNAYEESPYKNDIVFIGRLEPEQLHKVLASAKAMVYTSLFEGFGIPILEALNCDTPVLTSNNTSMPEVGGDAAVYADPYSVDSIADGLYEVSENIELRKQLIDKGRQQRLKFSWDRSSELLWGSIEKALL